MLAPSSVKIHPLFDSLIVAYCDWARNRRLDRQSRQRLDECDRYEVARMAREAGLSPMELSRMSKLGPDAAKLLLDRMAALHLDSETLAQTNPSTMRAVQRLCSSCTSKKRCQRNLIHDRDIPVWRKYCPNVGTLDALQSEAANTR